MEDKVANLDLAVKGYKDKITNVQFTYVMNINELQMELQPTMPQEVQEQREADLKAIIANIAAVVEDCGKLLDERLQIQTSLQEDPNTQKLQEDIQQKQQQLEEIQETVRTLPISQKLAKVNEGNTLQKKIDELRKEEKAMIKRTKPWQDQALKLYQAVDEKLQEHRQRERKQ